VDFCQLTFCQIQVLSFNWWRSLEDGNAFSKKIWVRLMCKSHTELHIADVAVCGQTCCKCCAVSTDLNLLGCNSAWSVIVHCMKDHVLLFHCFLFSVLPPCNVVGVGIFVISLKRMSLICLTAVHRQNKKLRSCCIASKNCNNCGLNSCRIDPSRLLHDCYKRWQSDRNFFVLSCLGYLV